MSNTGTNSRPLPPSKKYHFHIIYNHEQSPLSATEDNQKSLEYAELTASILTSAGLDKSYYHHRDARPGRNIFTELFRVIEESQYTLLIVTPGFIDNCWAKYAGLAAFKKLLDKKEDHRLIALAFKLTDDEVPEELCQHEVLHFRDSTEDDEIQWSKLKQVMIDGDNVATQEHRPITESGDNRLHTDLNNLMAHPDGETSLSLRNLQIDGDRENNTASGGDHTRGANSSPGQTGLIQRTESLQIDGDDSVSDDMHLRQTTALGTSSGLNAQRAATSGQKTESLRPQLTNTLEAGGSEPNTKERELMTKQLLGQKPVTLDLKKSPSPSPDAGYSMPLEASPTVSAPVVAKTLPPPAGVGKAGKSSNTTDKEKTAVKQAVHTEIANTERSTAVQGNNSLTNDNDLTFDDGGSSQSVNDGATSQTEQKVLFNGHKEENLHDLQLNIASTQTENRATDNESQAVGSSENVLSDTNFQELHLESLQAGMSPESGFDSKMITPEVQEVIAAQSVEPEGSTYRSGDSSGKSGVPESEISRDDSITELKQIETGSSAEATQNTGTDRGELTTAYSDSSERLAPEGEDADDTFGDGSSAAASSSGKSSSEDKQTRSSSYNWSAFAVHCMSRAFSTTDSLLSYW